VATPTTKKTVRVSIGALLLAEKATHKELRKLVKDTSYIAAGEAATNHDNRNDALALLLLLASRRLAQDAEEALKKARYRAWQVGARRLQAELRAADAVLAAESVDLTPPNKSTVQLSTSAEALALAWRQRALYAIGEAEREKTSAVEAIGAVRLDDNVARTAATENAQAYDAGHVDASEGLSGDPGITLVDRWEAMLDACPTCTSLDGTTTPVGEPFSSGEEPGFVHPRCRCIRTTVKD
jgi:hypothetical protein